MIDLDRIRERPREIEELLRTRDRSVSLREIMELDDRRKDLIGRVEKLRHRRNEGSERIGALKREGKDEQARELIEEMGEIGEEIDQLEEELEEVREELRKRMVNLPNIPHPSVPVSENEEDKVVLREYGEKREFDFQPQNHLELGDRLELFDFERAAKIAGSRFPLYWGDGAALEMALLNFMFFFQIQRRGYRPVFPPFLATEESFFTSAQLPKFEQELYRCPQDELYLNPTAESILANLHRDEILTENELPLKYAAYTTCFRREAGSYGEEERGLIRTHQFNKVELFQFVSPERSYEALDGLIGDAEAVLQELDLHYRVVLLPTADLAQQASKTVDLEVWIPTQDQYYEVSSCSNCEDFQARRGKMRFRPGEDKKPRYLHTLNGSGLATSRLMVSLLENNQNSDGSITVPQVLRESLGKERLG